MKALRIPEATISRLSHYSRFLERLEKRGIITVSSGEIAKGVGVSPAQVRKDLAYFGEFGTRGVGYNVKDLIHYIMKILGLTQNWPVILVGAGNLGTALCTYRGFTDRGFNIVGVFDNDLTKIGKRIVELEVYPLERMAEVVAEHNVKIGIIAVPISAVPDIAKVMVDAGIHAILTFGPVVLDVPERVIVRNVDLTVKLEILTFNLNFRDLHSIL
ncbi:MAG: redox-sensing transcriptional repressor Rex [Eubacteriales bacterium]|nr:redox-sensing transcriptional repressor Rex [Bacillota bacterium]MBV1726437.1 redox-sensing transcriptional repressor Rex [Desulforudis sp.]MDP3051773.1 redox-sensing transcriptional repressor Rex [Eubacteriales bacterium]MDQ7788886.1 redox-sensing transcriptional repressor Rex [Clostridia bacterium]MBU4554278.1 redox-sensing transcriptional repressor Rex [Bacillota bacterium]